MEKMEGSSVRTYLSGREPDENKKRAEKGKEIVGEESPRRRERSRAEER